MDSEDFYQLSPGLASAFDEPFFSRTPTPDSIPDINPSENTSGDTLGTSSGAIPESETNGTSSLSSNSEMLKNTSLGAVPKVVHNGSTSHSSIVKSPLKRSHEQSSVVKKKFKKSSEREGENHRKLASSKFDVGEVATQVMSLSEMFPEADPQFLWDRCEHFGNNQIALNDLVMDMLSKNDYPRVASGPILPKATAFSSKSNISNGHILPKMTTASTARSTDRLSSATSSNNINSVNSGASTSRARSDEESKHPSYSLKNASSLREIKEEMANATDDGAHREPWRDQFEIFVQILPEADPSYLEEKACALLGMEEEIRNFVADALEKKDYPSRKNWLWRQEQLALQKKYTEEFSIENFLEIIPDPFSFFTNQNRKSNKNLGEVYLRNKYRKLKVTDIKSTFLEHHYNLTLTCRALNEWKGQTLKSRRQGEFDLTKNEGGNGVDVPFLQEVAFIENESKIVHYLEDKKQRRKKAFDQAKANGELLECQCCFDDEILAEDTRTCSEGHLFCISCVQKSSEQRIGEGHTTFPCLADCSAEFRLQTLQEVLKPTVFSRMVQRKQAEEVKAAGIEDLVQCPFCDFCNIPPKEDKVFRCLNPDCAKESCRLCKEENHVPLRCDEVERKTEVEMRTYIENKMTEALVRTCWKCQKKFVKEDGCNKMTCQCGAMMCYVCRQPVQDYKHFNGQGRDAYQKCALYSDHHALEAEEVKKVAEQAKREALAMKPNVALKYDPTKLLPVYQPRPQNNEHDNDEYDSDDDVLSDYSDTDGPVIDSSDEDALMAVWEDYGNDMGDFLDDDGQTREMFEFEDSSRGEEDGSESDGNSSDSSDASTLSSPSSSNNEF